MLTVREISSKQDKKKFFEFQNKIFKKNKYYVPTLISDEEEEFDPKKNGAFAYCDCKMFLAERDGKIVGRIAGVWNRAYNKKTDAKQMRFTRFDFIDDYEVSSALYDAVKKWALELGMNEMMGPIGFSDLDKQGLLYEGFDQMDLYVTPYNYPYYINHYERLGLVKKADWFEYEITIPEKLDPRILSVAEKAKERYGYKTERFTNIKQIKPWIKPALKIMNAAFEPIFGAVPLEDKQLEDYSKTLLMIGDPDFVELVFNKDHEPIGYGFMAPNISRALRACKGHLFPFGALQIAWDLKHAKALDFYEIGVLPEYQNLGVNSIIMVQGFTGAQKHHMTKCYTGPELEDNFKIQAQWAPFEKKMIRKRRCYITSIA
ncbi:MAG: hypothetical protein LKK19_02050 [Bacteroidales bacterium]|jgi:hypothetical protein|nr:hypothetical protein [Bacteroidales bacterium]MCI2121468.1 hypothetical protein [Bacteroidales bacterium]MCI2145265.1 hypothetical protein [Bacteroidales bacterium]